MKLNDILKVLEKAKIQYKLEKEDENNMGDIIGFSSFFHYREGTVTFISPDRKFADYQEQFSDKQIALMIIGKDELIYSCFKNAIRVPYPHKAFFAIIEQCFNDSDNEEITGISSDPEIYSKYSYVSTKAVLGKNVRIGVGCVIEGNVVIGDDTEIHHNVVIRNKTKIGKRCTIHSGVVIGEYGFGYIVEKTGQKTMLKHYGGVTIEDDVHIGDNSVIIRGAIDDTVIKRGVKLNTMVHIAHNDIIGEDTLITAPCHVCGSVSIGKGCHIAGSIIRNQRNVGDKAIVGLGTVVVKDVNAGTTVIGNPARVKP